MNLLNQYPATASPSTTTSTPPHQTATTYIIRALHIVLDQRLTAGKQSYSRNLIKQFLNLTTLPPKRQQKLRAGIPVSDDANGWTLLHLNANVQAVLYSARMLKQTVDFLKKHQEHVQAESNDETAKLAQVVRSMPPIEDLFLDPIGVRHLMQQVPREKLREMISPIFELVGGSLDETNDTARENSSNLEVVVSRKSKKRKKAKVEEDSKSSAPAAKPRSTNPFDLLMQ